MMFSLSKDNKTTKLQLDLNENVEIQLIKVLYSTVVTQDYT